MTLERKKHRVAVVVFLEVDGYDECDAGSGGEYAVRQAFTGRRKGLPVDTEFVAANGKNTASIVDVMELGRAAGNGYLWTRPSGKAFPRPADTEEET